jgi:hypothetical protein
MGAFTAEFKTIHAQCEQLARENVCVVRGGSGESASMHV